MYTEIEIHETDFKDKYLIKSGGKSMYAGHIIRDIVQLLKEGRSRIEIHSAISGKHSEKIDMKTIDDIVDHKINGFLKGKKGNSFYKIAKLFNPGSIPVPQKLLTVFEPAWFYPILFISFILNICIYAFSARYKAATVKEGILVYVLLFAVLIIHELGHALAARKYKTDVKEIGFGLYYVLPVFYVDLNEAWKLDRRKRMLINFSGIFIQLILGLLIFLLGLIFKGSLNVLMSLFMVNFVIILLNLNPFLKFDGYWIASDLFNENDLAKTSNEIIRSIFKSRKTARAPLLVIFSMLKLVFVGWILFLIMRSAIICIKKIITGVSMEWYHYLPVFICLFVFFKIFYNILNKKNELRKRKKDL